MVHGYARARGAWRCALFRKILIATARCIARREALLFEAEKEGDACSRRFLSETRTSVREEDVACLLRLLDQVRAHEKASPRVDERLW